MRCADRKRRRLPAAVLVCGLAIGAWVSGCDTGSSFDESTQQAPAAAAPDQWLPIVKRAHQLADSSVDEATRQAAIEALGDAFERVVVAEQTQWVRQDLAARLAQLELDQGRPERAVEWTGRGLDVSDSVSVPAATLWTLRGRALEASGDGSQAVKSYHRALLMNEELMERSLRGEP